MKKILILILSLTLVGCPDSSKNNSVNIGKESKYTLSDNLVSIRIKEKTLTKSSATFILTNHTDENYDYGDSYSLEYEKDGIWYEIIPNNDMNFNLIAYLLKSKESKEITINWKYHYGKLVTGKYRIIKNVFRQLDRPIESNDFVYIGIEFIIK